MSLHRVSIAYSVAAVGCANVLHFDDAGADSTPEAVCAEIRDGYIQAMLGIIGGEVTVTGVKSVTVVRIGDGPSAELPLLLFNAGTNGLTDAPQLAMLFQIRTGLSGRTRRGRFFVSGIPDNGSERGRISAPFAPAVTTFRNAVSGRYVGAGATSALRLGVFSRTRFALISNPFDSYFARATSLSNASVLSPMHTRKPV